MMLLQAIIADDLSNQLCQIGEQNKIYRLTYQLCQFKTEDSSESPIGLELLDNTGFNDDWSYINVNSLEEVDSCKYAGIVLGQQTSVKANFIFDAVVDLADSIEKCTTIDIAPLYQASNTITDIKMYGNIYLANVSTEQQSKIVFHQTFYNGSSSNVQSSVELYSAVYSETTHGRHTIASSILLQSPTTSLPKLSELTNVKSYCQTIANGYYVNIYAPTTIQEIFGKNLTYCQASKMIEEGAMLTKNCTEIKYTSYQIYSCLNYTVYFDKDTQKPQISYDVLDGAKLSTSYTCNGENAIFNRVCIKQSLCQFKLESVKSLSAVRCVETCDQSLGYYELTQSKQCQSTTKYLKNNQVLDNCSEDYILGQLCVSDDEVPAGYIRQQSSKVLIEPTATSCASLGKSLLLFDAQMTQCVSQCPNGLFAKNGKCILVDVNPEGSITNSSSFVNTCDKNMLISLIWNPIENDLCHISCINDDKNQYNGYCIESQNKCSYPLVEFNQFTTCIECTLDKAFYWMSDYSNIDKYTCGDKTLCKTLYYNMSTSAYECETESYCTVKFETEVDDYYVCGVHCDFGKVFSANNGCIEQSQCYTQNLVISDVFSACIKPTSKGCKRNLYIKYDENNYQCVQIYDDNQCNKRQSITATNVLGTTINVCADCLTNDTSIIQTIGEETQQCSTNTACDENHYKLENYTNSIQTIYCFRQTGINECITYTEIEGLKNCKSNCGNQLISGDSCVDTCASNQYIQDQTCIDSCDKDQFSIIYSEQLKYCKTISQCPEYMATNNKQCFTDCATYQATGYILRPKNGETATTCVESSSCKYQQLLADHTNTYCFATTDNQPNSYCKVQMKISDTLYYCYEVCPYRTGLEGSQCVLQCSGDKYIDLSSSTCVDSCTIQDYSTVTQDNVKYCSTNAYTTLDCSGKQFYDGTQCVDSCTQTYYVIQEVSTSSAYRQCSQLCTSSLAVYDVQVSMLACINKQITGFIQSMEGQTQMQYDSNCSFRSIVNIITSSDKKSCQTQCKQGDIYYPVDNMINKQCTTTQCGEDYVLGYIDGSYYCFTQCNIGQYIFEQNNVCVQYCTTKYVYEKDEGASCQIQCPTEYIYIKKVYANQQYSDICFESCSITSINSTYYMEQDGKMYCYDNCIQYKAFLDVNDRKCVNSCETAYATNSAYTDSKTYYYCQKECSADAVIEIVQENNINTTYCHSSCSIIELKNKMNILEQESDDETTYCVSQCNTELYYYAYQSYICRDYISNNQVIDGLNKTHISDCNLSYAGIETKEINKVNYKNTNIYYCDDDATPSMCSTLKYEWYSTKSGYGNQIYTCGPQCNPSIYYGAYTNTYQLQNNNKMCQSCVSNRVLSYKYVANEKTGLNELKIEGQLCTANCPNNYKETPDRMCVPQALLCGNLYSIYYQILIDQDNQCIYTDDCEQYIYLSSTDVSTGNEIYQCISADQCITNGNIMLGTIEGKQSCEKSCQKGYYALKTQDSKLNQCSTTCYTLLQNPARDQLFADNGKCTDRCQSNIYTLSTSKYSYSCAQASDCNGTKKLIGGLNGQNLCISSCPTGFKYLQNITGFTVLKCVAACPEFYNTISSSNIQCVDSCSTITYKITDDRKMCVIACADDQVSAETSLFKLNLQDSYQYQCVSSCDDYSTLYQDGNVCTSDCGVAFINNEQTQCVSTCNEQNTVSYFFYANKRICTADQTGCKNALYSVEQKINDRLIQCTSVCTGKAPYFQERQCVGQCSSNFLNMNDICIASCPELVPYKYFDTETSSYKCVKSCSVHNQYVENGTTKRCVSQPTYNQYVQLGNEIILKSSCETYYDAQKEIFGKLLRQCVTQCSSAFLVNTICVSNMNACNLLGLSYYQQKDNQILYECKSQCESPSNYITNVQLPTCITGCTNNSLKYALELTNNQFVCVASCQVLTYSLESTTNQCSRDCLYEAIIDSVHGNYRQCITESDCKTKHYKIFNNPSNNTLQCVSNCKSARGTSKVMVSSLDSYCIDNCLTGLATIETDSEDVLEIYCADSQPANKQYYTIMTTVNDYALKVFSASCYTDNSTQVFKKETNSNECVTSCNSKLSIYSSEHAQFECINSRESNPTDCEYIRSFSGTDAFCVQEFETYCSGNISMPDKICQAGKCTTQFTYYYKTDDDSFCYARCPHNRILTTTKCYTEADTCQSGTYVAAQTIYKNILQCKTTKVTTIGQNCTTSTILYKSAIADEYVCYGQCFGTFAEDNETCILNNCKDNQYNQYLSYQVFTCIDKTVPCKTKFVDYVNECLRPSYTCYNDPLYVAANGSQICVQSCLTTDKPYISGSSKNNYVCNSQCPEGQYITSLSICADSCGGYNVLDEATNKCLYNTYDCSADSKIQYKDGNYVCVDQCDAETTLMENSRQCLTSCSLFQLQQGSEDTYQCIEFCDYTKYISSMKVCQSECDTQYFSYTKYGKQCSVKCPMYSVQYSTTELSICLQECDSNQLVQENICITSECDFGDKQVIYQDDTKKVCLQECSEVYIKYNSYDLICADIANCALTKYDKLTVNGLKYTVCVSSCDQAEKLAQSVCVTDCSTVDLYNLPQLVRICAQSCMNLYLDDSTKTCNILCDPKFIDNSNNQCVTSCSSNYEDITNKLCVASSADCQWQTTLANNTVSCTDGCASSYFIVSQNINSCQQSCPEGYDYTQQFLVNKLLKQCRADCDNLITYESQCLISCTVINMYDSNGTCISACPDNQQPNVDGTCPAQKDNSGKSNGGMIAGIIIGVIVVIAVVVVAIIFIMKKKSTNKTVNYGAQMNNNKGAINEMGLKGNNAMI